MTFRAIWVGTFGSGVIANTYVPESEHNQCEIILQDIEKQPNKPDARDGL